ncbi:MAG: hypothetical protein J6C19_15010 [Lachnospiraceae bacterium]|nr:hypothetical protein [Lachnospiraceae bacterium]
MQFKELEWEEHISDGIIISSNCKVRVYGYDIIIEFRISYDKKEDKYCLCSFGIGSIRRIRPDIFSNIDEAKTAAYRIYCNEMCRMKKAIDSFVLK